MGAKPCCISSFSAIDTQLISKPTSKQQIQEKNFDIAVPKSKEKPIPIEIIQSKQPDDDYCFQVIMNLYETIKEPDQRPTSIHQNYVQTNQGHYETYTTKSQKHRKTHQSIDSLSRKRSSSHHEMKTRSLTTRITQESKININTLFTVNIKGILKKHQDEDNYLTSKGKSVHFKDNHHHKHHHKHFKSHMTNRRDSYK